MAAWPTKSTDPAANAAIAVFLVMAAAMLIVVGGIFLLSVLLVLGHRQRRALVRQPANADRPALRPGTAAQHHCEFPEPEKFTDAYIDRFLDAIRDDLPAYSVYLAMAHIADALYKAENLNNPLPPTAAANSIEEGRYRDQLIAHQRKTADAPHTLEIFNATLGKCWLDFIAALPPIAKATAEEFAKCDEVEAVRHLPADRCIA